FGRREATLAMISEKWSDYYKGKKQMPCRKCPDKSKARIERRGGVPMPLPEIDPEATVLLQYQGRHVGKVSFRGKTTGTYYRFKKGDQRYVLMTDAVEFLKRKHKGVSDFIRVESARPKEVQVPQIPMVQPVIEQPEFLTMPDEVIFDLKEVTISRLKEMLPEIETDRLMNLIDQERDGRDRKGAVKAIKDELSGRK
ncbi:unnamed protein product, partial [marine sediment metagenome]